MSRLGQTGRQIVRDLILGAVLGAIILGGGGRIVMRVIAHLEGRTPLLTPEGTITVIFAGAMAGTTAGLAFWIIQRFIRQQWMRTVLFFAFCVAFTVYGVRDLLPRPMGLFVLLTTVFVIVYALIERRRAAAMNRIIHTADETTLTRNHPDGSPTTRS